MSEPTHSSSSSLAEEPEQKQANDKTTAASSTPKTQTSEKQQFGSAKTENLRDSGLWRIILPTAVVIFCLVLFVIPLVILIPLLTNSLVAAGAGNAKEAQLIWVWITMIVLEVIIAFVVARGLLKIFLTQAGNYQF